MSISVLIPDLLLVTIFYINGWEEPNDYYSKSVHKISTILRKLHPTSLAAYCKENQLEFTVNEEADIEDIATEFLKYHNGLGKEKESIALQIDVDFSDIANLDTNKGTETLLEKARLQHITMPEALNELHTTDKAMWFYLNHRSLFRDVATVEAIDSSKGWVGFWTKQNATVEQFKEKQSALEDRIRKYFTAQERGHHCYVDFVRRDDSICLVANIEDYTQSTEAFGKDGKPSDVKKFKPVFRVYYRYCPTEGEIKVKIRSRLKGKTDLAAIFAEVMFAETITEFDVSKLRLDRLLDPEFTFPQTDDLESAVVKSITLDFPSDELFSVTLVSGSGKHGLSALRPRIEQMRQRADGTIIPLHALKVRSAKIGLTFKKQEQRVKYEKRSVVFDLTAPCTCTLAARPIDGRAWDMLRTWKIAGKQ